MRGEGSLHRASHITPSSGGSLQVSPPQRLCHARGEVGEEDGWRLTGSGAGGSQPLPYPDSCMHVPVA